MVDLRIILTLGIAIGNPSISRVSGSPLTCIKCHDSQAVEIAASVHKNLKCQECHGGRDVYELSIQDADRYASDHFPASGSTGKVQSTRQSPSPDSVPPAPRFDHGPSFLGKPARAMIPERCGTCHADVKKMNSYGLLADELSRYWSGTHGKTLAEKGDDRVAVCTDCHGSHNVLSPHNPASTTYPLNVPNTCATCHADRKLMESFGKPYEVVEEYRRSVHGRLLLEQHDTSAPTCATCHGNHAVAPRKFSSVEAVCGKCHQQVKKYFSASIHVSQSAFHGCIQCHGGAPGSHSHRIDRITIPVEEMVRKYDELLKTTPQPTPQQITAAIHPQPRQVADDFLSSCTECHDDPDEDENLASFFQSLDHIAESERKFIQTEHRLDELSKGVLIVSDQKFKLEDARTTLITLAPLQHALSLSLIHEQTEKLDNVYDQINADINSLERGLHRRKLSLVPIWVFALCFSVLLFVKYRRLKAQYVLTDHAQTSREDER